MTPVQLLLALVVSAACAYAGYHIGKSKGRPSLGVLLGLLLGVIGVIIIACVPHNREAVARRQYEMQVEEARRAGYLFPPQPPQDWPPQDLPPQDWMPPKP